MPLDVTTNKKARYKRIRIQDVRCKTATKKHSRFNVEDSSTDVFES